jgi:Transposase DDE domain group 1
VSCSRAGFIVTNLPKEPDYVVWFYNRRGTAEQHINECKYVFHWTWLSCRRFFSHEMRLQLHALAYNLATFFRCIDPPAAMFDWSLISLHLKRIKIGDRVACHARAPTVQLAEVAITGSLVRAMFAPIRRPAAPPLCT